MFPSPCGVNIVGNFVRFKQIPALPVVSVPLRGKYCRELLIANGSLSPLVNHSFRPLAG